MKNHEHPLYAPSYFSAAQEPKEQHSQILPGLFQGGTDDDACIDTPRGLYDSDDLDFDAVVTLYAWAQPVDWGVEELRFGIMDSYLEPSQAARVVEAAAWAHRRWKSGSRVLIRCQAGLNRSGLLTALVLMLDGWSAAEAITHIRQQRSQIALFNDDYVDWLVSHGSAALAQVSPSKPQAA